MLSTGTYSDRFETGKLGGKAETFYLAHRATMTKGDAESGEMQVTLVKGSAQDSWPVYAETSQSASTRQASTPMSSNMTCREQILVSATVEGELPY